MANCPFRALARSHTGQVCRMNHALIGGLVQSVDADLFDVRFDPGENRCCVTLAAVVGDGARGSLALRAGGQDLS
jgi:predicted ArsR family transcriptional regulator